MPARRWGIAVLGLVVVVGDRPDEQARPYGRAAWGAQREREGEAGCAGTREPRRCSRTPIRSRSRTPSSVAWRTARRRRAAPAKIDSATLAAIRADVEKSVLDSLQKMRPPQPAPGSQGTPSVGARGATRGVDFTGMTQAQIDSIVRSTRAATDFARGFPSRANPGVFVIPPRGSAERVQFDQRIANMGPPRHVLVARSAAGPLPPGASGGGHARDGRAAPPVERRRALRPGEPRLGRRRTAADAQPRLGDAPAQRRHERLDPRASRPARRRIRCTG